MLKFPSNKFFKIIISSKKYFFVFGCILFLLIILKLFNYSLTDTFSDIAYEDYFIGNNKKIGMRIPKKINFAGEKVPVSDILIRNAIERELLINTFWKSKSLILHKRAAKWFPVIEPILKKNNIPEDFKYITLVESQLMNVISPRDATGFWQIMECTGVGYGMEINEEVDERYHVIKSTEMACKYFKDAYKIFNNWTLVAASYNYGMGGIKGQLDQQKVKSYYELKLNSETSRYVYRILAMKEIIARPKVYGFMLRKKDVYPFIATKKIRIDSAIHNLSDFAIAQKINYKILKSFNPWLLTNTLTNSGKKKYFIEIPNKGIEIYDIDGDYNGSDSSKINKVLKLVPVSEVCNDSVLPNNKLKK